MSLRSIAAAVNTARSADNKITLVQDILPLIGVLLGLVLLVFGLLLLLREDRDEYYEYEEEEEAAASA